LPLDNHSGDPSQEYFSDGMTEELISAISKISSLRVISRTSTMRYKGARKSLPAIAKELRVDAVVEGSVARSEQKVRITAQLIHAPDDRHCKKALEINPHYPNAFWFLALSLEQTGQLAESIAQLEKAVNLSGGSHFRALLGRAHALAGERNKAQTILDELETLSGREYVSPFDIAVVCAGLGDLTSTFKRLEEAYQQRVFRIIELTLPMFDDLRSDSRWQDLVRRIGLPN
jgi:tetratricopeptide (TPR) repeat protein